MARNHAWPRPAIHKILLVAFGLATVGVLFFVLAPGPISPIARLAAGMQVEEGAQVRDYWPTEEWRTSSPEAQDMDSSTLDQMMALVKEHDLAVDSAIVIRHGYIVLEEYRNGYDQDKRHHIQSVTKSVASTLIGIAIQEGLIENVDQKMVDLLPDYTIANMDARKQSITLEHLLTMSDGMDWHEHDYAYTDRRNTLGQMWASSDAVQYVLDRPMARDPGESWAYNSGTSILLGGILEQATGQNVLAFAREYLFDPIGIGEVYWAMAPGNHFHTDGGLHMIPRDMARLGYLMLNNGTWDGREILPSKWVSQASRAHYQTSASHGYGYQWWTLPGTDAYAAMGHYDQYIFIVPNADLVVVFTANIPDAAPHPLEGMLTRYILAACTDTDYATTHRYADYGFSFDYPAAMNAFETPFPGRDSISNASGMIQFISDFDPIEIIDIGWDTAKAELDLGTVLDQFYAAAESSGTKVDRQGTLGTMTKDGHKMVYQRFSATAQELQFEGMMGAWYCEQAGRVYLFGYVGQLVADTQDLESRFQQHLDSFDCHEASLD